MQAAPVRATALPKFTDALRAVESLLMSGGQRTARRNAWNSVLEDRRRAKDRVEAERFLDVTTVTTVTTVTAVTAATAAPLLTGLRADG
ncbi:hypothetical protein OHN99_23765 [Streptomyces jietaisiensis]|jgi:hypothetical protein|uniref:Uncharacterized protein n=2 Tax=Streptomyces griseoaurantiacus TaxID=68213 RepID=A0A1G7PMM0_9ACTN|nr:MULTISPECIES: hypothetical protein [Streptomyces]MBA5222463.1 hypothetical protein [Streptomyces griseoaurantiacus]MCF0090025.1 hypothetical protein [Streptomyces sp. MH192]MCF0102239.1 hypothetical protein [Streptomyces sp. MH191]MDX3359913.1 hypothetical protein [Streptomyces sp. ME02-6978.2a]SDF87521.1 hypothetical protein SAMN05216260_111252 [Streptomyces jietaisiensis]